MEYKQFYCPQCEWEGDYKDASVRMYTWTIYCPNCQCELKETNN